MALRFRLLILLFLLTGAAAFGQNDTLRFSVRGVVRDAESGRPLPAVGVSIPGSQIAVITNDDGTVLIQSPEQPKQLALSLMGYRNLRKKDHTED